MQHPVARYAVLALGAFLCIAAVVPVPAFLMSARGVAGPAATDAAHPVQAAVAMAAAAAVCTAIACAVGRAINAAVGLFALGCGMAALAGRTGTIVDAGFDGDALLPIAVETIAWGAVVLGMSMAVFRASGPLLDLPARRPGGPFLAEVFNADAARGIVAAGVAVAVAWVALRTDMKGQAIGVAAAGSAIGAIVARRVQGPTQPILLVAMPVLGFGLAQLATALLSAGPLDRAIAQQALPGWSRAMPLDVVAGALIGVPVGLGWSKPGE
ncbi:MAG: hypothetical protein RI990_970 [Planctomycetota bacterium]|jgi:hypothetical protein